MIIASLPCHKKCITYKFITQARGLPFNVQSNSVHLMVSISNIYLGKMSYYRKKNINLVIELKSVDKLTDIIKNIQWN